MALNSIGIWAYEMGRVELGRTWAQLFIVFIRDGMHWQIKEHNEYNLLRLMY